MSCDTRNLYGADPNGGVLVLVRRRSRLQSRRRCHARRERTLAALGMPVLFPRNSEELIVFGLYGIELSRASGCWVGMKVVSDVADGLSSVDRDFAELTIERPQIVLARPVMDLPTTADARAERQPGRRSGPRRPAVGDGRNSSLPRNAV